MIAGRLRPVIVCSVRSGPMMSVMPLVGMLFMDGIVALRDVAMGHSRKAQRRAARRKRERQNGHKCAAQDSAHARG